MAGERLKSSEGAGCGGAVAVPVPSSSSERAIALYIPVHEGFSVTPPFGCGGACAPSKSMGGCCTTFANMQHPPLTWASASAAARRETAHPARTAATPVRHGLRLSYATGCCCPALSEGRRNVNSARIRRQHRAAGRVEGAQHRHGREGEHQRIEARLSSRGPQKALWRAAECRKLGATSAWPQ